MQRVERLSLDAGPDQPRYRSFWVHDRSDLPRERLNL